MTAIGAKIASPFEALERNPRVAPDAAPIEEERARELGTALLRACATGNEAAANALLDSGMASVAQLHKSGVNALWMACHQGLDALACRIATLGGPETFRVVHSGTRTNALFRACSNGLSQVGALLVAEVRRAARHMHAQRGALSSRARARSCPLRMPPFARCVPTNACLLALPPAQSPDCMHAEDGTDALLRACESGMPQVALMLAQQGKGDVARVDLNNGTSALFWAAMHGEMTPVVAELIARGADVAVSHIELDAMELEEAPEDAMLSGATALTVAAHHVRRASSRPRPCAVVEDARSTTSPPPPPPPLTHTHTSPRASRSGPPRHNCDLTARWGGRKRRGCRGRDGSGHPRTYRALRRVGRASQSCRAAAATDACRARRSVFSSAVERQRSASDACA